MTDTPAPDNSATPALGRRAFLRSVGLTAGAATVVGTSREAESKARTLSQTGEGYHETEHVRRAYEAAAF
ncbi:conserved hypothetical protein [Candidatus Terasakiella magnetica]|nr:conserved hypothetical protein [Candidatus Terasakiella magnetica]